MKELIASFTNHLRTAIDISESVDLGQLIEEVANIVILGMGGSGIGGTVAAQILSDEIKVPIISCKDYNIPAFVSGKSMIIVSSFSGNTEETLIALEQAEQITSNIYCICSGGKLEIKAKSNGYKCIIIPGGIPPRAAFGLSIPQLFKIFSHNNLIEWDNRDQFEKCIRLIENNIEEIQDKAMNLAKEINDKRVIIYAQTDFEGVCIRFRQQLNENSKKLCWHHTFPEMNHNELVGWKEKNEALAVIILRNEDDFSRNQTRMELSKEILHQYTKNIFEVNSQGNSKLEKSLYLIHFCDWVSAYVADINGTDPIEIEVINYLKGSLEKS